MQNNEANMTPQHSKKLLAAGDNGTVAILQTPN